MAIKEEPEAIPFADEAFRNANTAFLTLAQQLSIERLIERKVVDWQGTTANFKTSGTAQVDGNITGSTCNLSSIGTFADLNIAQLEKLSGGIYDTSDPEDVNDLWGIIAKDYTIGGTYTEAIAIRLKGGTYKELL